MAPATPRRTRNLFDPESKTSFKLSRSRLENFIKCPRCFYLDRRLGVEPPGSPPYTLNSAVDGLLKKEFDIYRKKGAAHPLMEKYGVKAIPFSHPMMDEWRETFKGVRVEHRPTGMTIFGAVDDLWVDLDQNIYVVDYKSTSSLEPITLDSVYKDAFKRQMEIYQWLLRNQGFKVSDTGYFVYCNADKSKETFDSKLEFAVEIIAYQGNANWVEETIMKAFKCLQGSELPEYSPHCEFCGYRQASQDIEVKKNPRPKPDAQIELFT